MRSFTGLAIFGVYFLSMRYQNPFNQRGGGGGGGGLLWKRVPTAVRPLESRGCRNLRQLKKRGGGGAVLISWIGGLSESVQLIFHVK